MKYTFLRLTAWLTACILAFGTLTLPLFAEEAPSADTEAVADGGEATAPDVPDVPDTVEPPKPIVLSDINAEDWFYPEVTRLISRGIIHGCPDGNFYPARDVSVAEFVKMLILSVGALPYEAEEEPLFPENWASPYLRTAYDLGIITDEELAVGIVPEAPITRGEMTKMAVKALGIEPAPIDSPFDDDADIWALTAYDAYLIKGVPNERGAIDFAADGFTSRSEAAALSARILDYSEDSYGYFKSAVLAGAESGYINTEAELIDLFYLLNREFMTDFTFMTTVPPNRWVSIYRRTNALYLEYFYSAHLDCSYVPQSNIYTIKLAYHEDMELLKKYFAEADAAADAAIADIITDDMTERQKLEAIHDYIVLVCRYDIEGYSTEDIPFASRTAYGVLVDGKAVCQGYAAALNLLCRKAGIRCAVVTGTAPSSPDAHAWNMVLIDGVIYYIDATHDDPVPDVEGAVSRKHFMLSAEELLSLGYVWDRSQGQIKYFY